MKRKRKRAKNRNMNNQERDEAIADLRKRVEELETKFLSHFHGADELHEFTDPPIVPVPAESEPAKEG